MFKRRGDLIVAVVYAGGSKVAWVSVYAVQALAERCPSLESNLMCCSEVTDAGCRPWRSIARASSR